MLSQPMNSMKKMKLSGTNKPRKKSEELITTQLMEMVIQYIQVMGNQLIPTLIKELQVMLALSDYIEIEKIHYLFKK